ncbi:hypothetical protein PUR61_35380 [Streptomyces sp. BE20]|uniref:hypothetical protein n=1 Tax=Streptomyces sp. BE20 TaxID=3002525 RepID=UPI002E77267D|nr:hypothetical protein [Streptomyces sp. BE20]MEE1827430.1 hypothetical protein [Streptomyces sp. BE20]
MSPGEAGTDSEINTGSDIGTDSEINTGSDIGTGSDVGTETESAAVSPTGSAAGSTAVGGGMYRAPTPAAAPDRRVAYRGGSSTSPAAGAGRVVPGTQEVPPQ